MTVRREFRQIVSANTNYAGQACLTYDRTTRGLLGEQCGNTKTSDDGTGKYYSNEFRNFAVPRRAEFEHLWAAAGFIRSTIGQFTIEISEWP